MNIEELAFKDRRTLAQLNELVLLDIIEFLQNDRKQWINQFTQTHNESVEIQKENNELKKQLENYKKLGFKYLQDKNNNLENQQKEFIEYLEDLIKQNETVVEVSKYGLPKNCSKLLIDFYKQILQKYKDIIGDVKNEN